MINLADIRDPEVLHDFERGRTALRHIELDIIPIKGTFDLDHLKALHKHLFQDVYPWAGELRTVNIGKNGFKFCDYQQFGRHADYVFDQLKQDNFLKDLSPDAFAKKAAYYYQEINFGHYFREGNGRSIRTFFEQLSRGAGYELDWSIVPKNEYMLAVKESDDPNKLDGLISVFKRMISRQDANHSIQFEANTASTEPKKIDSVQNDKWIESKGKITLKDILKKTDGLPAMDNTLDVDAKILNAPVEKYQIVTENGVETVKVLLKGQDAIHNIRLENVPHLPKQLKNEMLDQAAAVNEPVIQRDNYMDL
ncbi:Fic/DOC family protein [Paenibacillus prosopidis]|uniref:Fic/DOC family protein n=1 Tax=Paenibacillus prosopidis TaxID=630520 RepID=UPI001FE28D2C|nr:Fic family protein [Paenibacillus prosopidis]